jgi:uncharacterized protein with ParB-like and HNH nuclease domain
VNLVGKEYFLGAAVLVNDGTFHLLLDGQQRLAASTILLAALRDKIHEFRENGARSVDALRELIDAELALLAIQ